jgi:ubiquinone/menaquinone biosynthesis C-methylase UbiE
MDPLTVPLVCIRCRTLLARTGTALECPKCGASYAVVGDVPVLVEAPTKQQLAQREYFDAEFAGYGRYRLENWRVSFIERIFPSLGIDDGRGPYLDVGVGGSGATVIEAARRGVEAVGCDLSEPGVLAARSFAREQGVGGLTQWTVCAAERLPFPDASFAAASAVAVLEHLDDDGAAVAELARVLRPGGLVWVTVPHAYRYMLPFVWPVYRWHDRRIGHKRHYDERRLERICEQAGLEHVRTHYSGHPVKLVQVLGAAIFSGMRRRPSRTWWRLERLDRRGDGRRVGAMQLSAVFRRPAEPRGYRPRSDAGA